MSFDSIPQGCEVPDLLIGQACLVVGGLALQVFGSAACKRSNDHALVAEPPLDNLASGCIDDEVVRVDGAGNNRLAKTGTRVNHSLTAAAGHRVGREKYTGNCGIDHLLNHDGEPHGAVI